MPVRLALKTFDFSIDVVKFSLKIGGLVVVVYLVIYYSSSISTLPFFSFFSKKVNDSEEYYGPIFERIKNAKDVKDVKDVIDEFDYEKLVKESSSWLKTWKKLKKIAAIPVAVVSFFRKGNKNETTIDDGDSEDSSKLLESLKHHTKITGKDSYFELTSTDLSELVDDWTDS